MAVLKSAEINTEVINDNFSIITYSHLPSGFGITLGNSLRRTLLSSVKGCSIFGVKVNNVKHEYTTIPGIKEDVTYIILNLKRLVVSCEYNDEKYDVTNAKLATWPVLTVNAKGKKVVTGADVVCPVGFKIVNRDVVIANLESDSATLNLEIYAGNGKGFRNHIENSEVIDVAGVIAVDSKFSPILDVGYEVDNKRIGKQDSEDILKLSITTNGSVTVNEALFQATDQLIEYLGNLADNTKELLHSDGSTKPNIGSDSLDSLKLRTASENALKRVGITSVSQLASMTLSQLKNIKGVKVTIAGEVKEALAAKGIELAD